MSGDLDGDLADLGVRELLDGYRTGAFTPVDAVDAALGRIDATDHALRATITVLGEASSEAARRSTERWRRNEARALDGVPFGLKDVIATSGVRTTGGSLLYGDWHPSTSATVSQRLVDAGGILLAKLATQEFAFGDKQNRYYGAVANPWSLDRTAGGSSSGSGAAVASGQLPLALGTDSGGSIRIPAAYCGISGFKPTYGLVPRTGVMPLSWTLDHVGPMARSVDDLGLALQVIAGADGIDPTCRADGYADGGAQDLRGLRIGVPTWFLDPCDPEIAAGTWAAAEVFRSAGASVTEVELPHLDLAHVTGLTIILGELASLHADHLARWDDCDHGFARRLAHSQFLYAGDYTRALRVRSVIQEGFSTAFESVDVLLTPANPVFAPEIEAAQVELGGVAIDWTRVIPRATYPFNVVGVPALVVPGGHGADGLPFAIQLAGRPHHDAAVLGVGRAFQQLTDHHRRRPPAPAPI